MENDIEKTKTEEAQQTIEAKEGEQSVEKEDKLSLRDALDVAFEATKEDVQSSKPNPKDIKEQEEEVVPQELKPLEPPAEYTTEEKEDFRQLSRKSQEAAIRIHTSRQTKLNEVRSAMREYTSTRELVLALEPYLKATGLKDPAEVALKKAVTMWKEFEQGDPRKAAAAYLKAKGIEPPSGLLEQEDKDEKITPLQERLDRLEKERAQERVQQTVQQFAGHWKAFEQEKNAAGSLKFPDLLTGEPGLQLASNIGSLVMGNHQDSVGFSAYIKARIPGASPTKLFEEAYKWFGGRVDDSAEMPRSQDSQKHIANSRRAASSIPGRAAHKASSGPVKKMTRREALEHALAEIREAEG